MSILYAVNIPDEPDSDDLLYAAESKEQAVEIVERLHKEIDAHYPNMGHAIKGAIYVTNWVGTADEHAESLGCKWWLNTSFV